MSDGESAPAERVDFFISYATEDVRWAEWIAWVLEDAGYSVVIQAWDFRPGQNFVECIDRATRQAQCTIAVLSRHYLESKFTAAEWQAAFAADPTGRGGRLLPVRIDDVPVTGLLKQVIWIDLVRLSEEVAKDELLLGVLQGRAKPARAPSYPFTGVGRTVRERPPFPSAPVGAALAAGVALGVAGKVVWDHLTQVKRNSLGMPLRLIPAGTFLMGTPSGDAGDEGPQRRVTLTNSFLLGVFPVTQDEYRQVIGKNPSNFKGDGRRPVESVSWIDAIDFCNRLSEREGFAPYYIEPDGKVSGASSGYRLPTEAEWEYACRAGTTTEYCFGDDIERLDEYGWYEENSYQTSHPVGRKKPNAWGLHDMHGNVWEWCQDWFGKYEEAGGSDNPQGPPRGVYRVVRGGSWSFSAVYCRSAYRNWYEPGWRIGSVGFRVARSPSSPRSSSPSDGPLEAGIASGGRKA